MLKNVVKEVSNIIKIVFKMDHALDINIDIKLDFNRNLVNLFQNQIKKNTQPCFLNPKSTQPSMVPFSKDKTDFDSFNHWFEHKGKRYQSYEFSQDQVKQAFESDLCESTNGSTSSKKTLSNPLKWSDLKSKTKGEFSKNKVEKE